LLVHMSMCYKRIMRKWMSDRLRRRKRGAGEGAKEKSTEKAKAPEPLQPKYFENDLQENTGATHEGAREPQPESEFEPQPDRAEANESRDQAASPRKGASHSSEPRTRPTRRRRRRGRGGARQAPETTTPASATDGSDAQPSSAEPETAAVPLPLDTGTPDTVAAEMPPTAAVPAAPRPSKGTVVLAIGLPGSGKSSWFKRHNIRPLSSDLLRELLFDDAEEQRFQDLVFSNLRSMLRARLIARRPLSYVDSTNLNPHERHGWIKLAKDYGYDVQGLFFDVPLEVCMDRHARRGRVVPEDIMRKMAAKLKPPTFDEGFSKITVVRVKKKE
jgi:predicted kinase